MLATIAQLAGLLLVIIGLSLAFGAGGTLTATGVAAVYVGAAADRRGGG